MCVVGLGGIQFFILFFFKPSPNFPSVPPPDSKSHCVSLRRRRYCGRDRVWGPMNTLITLFLEVISHLTFQCYLIFRHTQTPPVSAYTPACSPLPLSVSLVYSFEFLIRNIFYKSPGHTPFSPNGWTYQFKRAALNIRGYTIVSTFTTGM